MNRTIKFRGQDYQRHWHYGSLVIYNDGTFAIAENDPTWTDDGYHNDDFALIKIRQETVGESTGLLDKNGKEIYEGDIIGLPETDSNGVKFKNRFARVVEWINDGFFLIDIEKRCGEVRKYGDRLALEISLNSGYAGIARCLDKYDYAIIGNIHDNPELLKKGGEI